MTDNPSLAPPPGDLRGDEPPGCRRCRRTPAADSPVRERDVGHPPPFSGVAACTPRRGLVLRSVAPIDRARYADATSAWTGSTASNKSRSVRTGSLTDPVARQAT